MEAVEGCEVTDSARYFPEVFLAMSQHCEDLSKRVEHTLLEAYALNLALSSYRFHI